MKDRNLKLLKVLVGLSVLYFIMSLMNVRNPLVGFYSTITISTIFLTPFWYYINRKKLLKIKKINRKYQTWSDVLKLRGLLFIFVFFMFNILYSGLGELLSWLPGNIYSGEYPVKELIPSMLSLIIGTFLAILIYHIPDFIEHERVLTEEIDSLKNKLSEKEAKIKTLKRK